MHTIKKGWTSKHVIGRETSREWFKPICSTPIGPEGWAKFIEGNMWCLEERVPRGDADKWYSIWGYTSNESLGFDYLKEPILLLLATSLTVTRFREYLEGMNQRLGGLLKHPRLKYQNIGVGGIWKPGYDSVDPLFSNDLFHVYNTEEGVGRLIKAADEFKAMCLESSGICIGDARKHETCYIIPTSREGEVSYFVDDMSTNPAICGGSMLELAQAYWDNRIEPFQKHHPDIIQHKLWKWIEKHSRIPKPENDRIPDICEKDEYLSYSLAGLRFGKDWAVAFPIAAINMSESAEPYLRTQRLYRNEWRTDFLHYRLLPEDGMYVMNDSGVDYLKAVTKKNVIDPMQQILDIYRDVYEELTTLAGFKLYQPLPS